MSAEKRRIGVTLSKPYIDGMDRLVKKGVYFTYSIVVMAALRLLLEAHGIPLFDPEDEGR